jgi:hypothetical protein
MLALALYRQQTCGGCGGWLPETTNHDAEAYRVALPLRCGRCTAIGISQDAYTPNSYQVHATRWIAELR